MKAVNMIDVVLISAIFRKRSKLQAINQVNLRVAPRRAFERNNVKRQIMKKCLGAIKVNG
jgi:hypothetical protein